MAGNEDVLSSAEFPIYEELFGFLVNGESRVECDGVRDVTSVTARRHVHAVRQRFRQLFITEIGEFFFVGKVKILKPKHLGRPFGGLHRGTDRKTSLDVDPVRQRLVTFPIVSLFERS